MGRRCRFLLVYKFNTKRKSKAVNQAADLAKKNYSFSFTPNTNSLSRKLALSKETNIHSLPGAVAVGV
jgi:hypothetical protein